MKTTAFYVMEILFVLIGSCEREVGVAYTGNTKRRELCHAVALKNIIFDKHWPITFIKELVPLSETLHNEQCVTSVCLLNLFA